MSAAVSRMTASTASRLQRRRFWLRSLFFLLFVLAPPLNLFRFDLTQGHFVLLGQPWTLGLDPFLHGEADPWQVFVGLLLRGLLPIVLVGGALIYVSWRYGRLYCGWLCPHFSVVEFINGLMRRASGKPTLWERRPLPVERPDGRRLVPDRRYWLPAAAAILGFAFLWAVVLLSYLLPPAQVYGNLLHLAPTRNQGLFLLAATVAFTIEFSLARHLFCRYGCAVGLFQSLAWMSNRKAMVVRFDGTRARACIQCNAACDHACPMRLKPRSIKRRILTCTQCARCITACDQVQAHHGGASLLTWVGGDEALAVSDAEARHLVTRPRRTLEKS